MRPTELEIERFRWLETLSVIGRLDPVYTAYPREGEQSTPRERLDHLSNKWNTQTAPKPLKTYDVPIQWGIFGIGCGLGLIMAIHVARASAARYRWDPDEKRLTLPGGATLGTDDIEEFDRRKWHRYLMFATVKAGHAQLGGRELKFDLLKYAPLEAWILEMEAVVSPPEEDESGDEPGEPDEG